MECAESRIFGWAAARIDCHRPRQIAGRAEGFLIRPVAPAANCLPDWNTRDHKVGPGIKTLVAPPAKPGKRQDSGCERAVDRQSAQADVDRLTGMVAVIPP